MHPYLGWPFLSDPSHPVLSAVWAVLVHGLISLLVVLPIVWRSRRRALGAALAFAAGPALDLDHVVAAHTLDPSRLEHLAGGRPATHSMLLAVALGVLVLLLIRHIRWAWAVFAVVISHVLYDGAGGSERWLYPLSSSEGIPWLAFPVGMIVLMIGSELVSRRSDTPPRTHPGENAGASPIGISKRASSAVPLDAELSARQTSSVLGRAQGREPDAPRAGR
jgi:zinc transporter ZupT